MFVPSLRRFGTLSGKSVKSDPFIDFYPQLKILRSNILRLVESKSPVLSDISRYYFQQPSKCIRPLLALLFSLATNSLGKDWDLKLWESTHPGAGGCEDELDVPLYPLDILADYSPQHKARFGDTFTMLGGTLCFPQVQSLKNQKSLPRCLQPSHTFGTPMTILPTQYRLAEITEIIHVASLLHDDVVDGSALRRGVPAAPRIFPPNLCVLCGQFLAAISSLLLLQLRNPEVNRFFSRAQTNLVEGEILQAKDIFEVASLDGTERPEKQRIWNVYIHKSYLKTGAVTARGLRAAVMLGGCVQGEILREVAYTYGRNFGLAYQVNFCPCCGMTGTLIIL